MANPNIEYDYIEPVNPKIMAKTINLESIILEAYGCKDAHDFQKSFDVSMQMIKEISIEACRQALELAAENAKTKDIPSDYPEDDYKCVIVNKQSIRDTIKQIQ